MDVGDKEPNFVGSRKWIGSMEVSFCLDHLIGVGTVFSVLISLSMYSNPCRNIILI